MAAIRWLQEQADFPRFYLLSRDRQFEIATSGSCAQFQATRADARAWQGLREFTQAMRSENRLVVGGLAFNPNLECQEEWTEFPAMWFWSPKEVWLREGNALENGFRQSEEKTCRVLERHSAPDAAGFEAVFNSAKHSIVDGSLNKVVLARKVELKLDTNFEPLSQLADRNVRDLNSYQYCIELKPHHAFLGFSPEALCRVHGTTLHTEALAGTALQAQDLFSAKNVLEQKLVKEYLQDCLAPLSESIQVDLEDRAVGFDSLRHICTSITAQLRPETDIITILQSLHPSPAVCGVPLQAAYDFIEEFEPFSRGWYAGTLGVISPKRTEFLVAIRAILARGKLANLYSGVGIVGGSDLRSEWEELESKIKFSLARFV